MLRGKNVEYVTLTCTYQKKLPKYSNCAATYYSYCNSTHFDPLINTEALFSPLCKELYTQ